MVKAWTVLTLAEPKPDRRTRRLTSSPAHILKARTPQLAMLPVWTPTVLILLATSRWRQNNHHHRLHLTLRGGAKETLSLRRLLLLICLLISLSIRIATVARRRR